MAVVERTGEKGSPWTKKEMLDWYERAKKKLDGKRPTIPDMMPYHMTFIRLCGGDLGNIYRWSGDEPRPPGRPKTGAADD